MKRDIKLLAAFAATTVIAHLVVEMLKARRNNLYRYAAGESLYERTHPRKINK